MPETKKSSPLLIAAAWAVVVLPAAWGLSYTVKNAAKIFQRDDAPATGSERTASPATVALPAPAFSGQSPPTAPAR